MSSITDTSTLTLLTVESTISSVLYQVFLSVFEEALSQIDLVSKDYHKLNRMCFMREQSANDGLLDDTTVQDAAHDTRLRILYLYQLLLTQSDEDHPLTTKQITDKMEELHGIHMHRTTVPSDIALLKAAGF